REARSEHTSPVSSSSSRSAGLRDAFGDAVGGARLAVRGAPALSSTRASRRRRRASPNARPAGILRPRTPGNRACSWHVYGADGVRPLLLPLHEVEDGIRAHHPLWEAPALALLADEGSLGGDGTYARCGRELRARRSGGRRENGACPLRGRRGDWASTILHEGAQPDGRRGVGRHGPGARPPVRDGLGTGAHVGAVRGEPYGGLPCL